MPPGDLSPARRVMSLDEVQQPGDYFYNAAAAPDADGQVSLWFLLPTADPDNALENSYERKHNGLHRIASPIWTITEHEDGSVSSQPSIGCGVQPYYWHGYLDPGNIWREV